MRPWTEPACRTLFPLLLPKHRTDGSWEDRRSRQPVPQTTSDGRREASKPHWSTLRICGGRRASCSNRQRIERRRCELREFWGFTSRYFLTQSKNTTLDFSSSNWDLSLINIGLYSVPFRKTCTVLGTAAVYIYNLCFWSQKGRPTFVFSLLLHQLLIEIPCFLQISRFNYQLLLQLLIKGSGTKNQKVFKNNSTHLSQGEAFRCFQHARYFFHPHSFPLHLHSRAQQPL